MTKYLSILGIIIIVWTMVLVSYSVFTVCTIFKQKQDPITVLDVNYPRLLKTAPDWIEKFGDNKDTRFAYNIVYLKAVLESHQKKILEINEKFKKMTIDSLQGEPNAVR